MSKYHEGLTLADVMADEELAAIAAKHLPQAGNGAMYRRIKDVPLERLLQRVNDPARKERLSALIAELKQL